MIYVRSARNSQRLFTMMSLYSWSSNTRQHSILPSHSSCTNSISDSKTRSNWQSRRTSGKNAHYTVKVYTCAETKRSGYYIFGIKKWRHSRKQARSHLCLQNLCHKFFFRHHLVVHPYFPSNLRSKFAGKIWGIARRVTKHARLYYFGTMVQVIFIVHVYICVAPSLQFIHILPIKHCSEWLTISISVLSSNFSNF